MQKGLRLALRSTHSQSQLQVLEGVCAGKKSARTPKVVVGMGREGGTNKEDIRIRESRKRDIPKSSGGGGGVKRQGQMLGAQTEKEASRFGNEVATGDLQWSQSGRPD